MDITRTGQTAMLLLVMSIIIIIGIFITLVWFATFMGTKRGSTSPYTKQPLLLGVDIAVSLQRHIEGFLLSLPQPENDLFEFSKAAVCNQTGRIFPNCVTPGEVIHLKWNFLQKRYPGRYVSWGSLNETQKAIIRTCHQSMEGFQVDISSSRPLPQEIEPYYAMIKPGPLYVDMSTKILLGWQIVPGTDFEVLVVQKPIIETLEDTI